MSSDHGNDTETGEQECFPQQQCFQAAGSCAHCFGPFFSRAAFLFPTTACGACKAWSHASSCSQSHKRRLYLHRECLNPTALWASCLWSSKRVDKGQVRENGWFQNWYHFCIQTNIGPVPSCACQGCGEDNGRELALLLARDW